MSLAERIRVWDTTGAGTPDITPDPPEDIAELKDDVYMENFMEAEEFAFSSKQYEWLRRRICNTILLTRGENTTIEMIADKIRSSLDHVTADKRAFAPIYRAVFDIAWDPRGFIAEKHYQIPADQVIGAIITLNGVFPNAQAATCAQYMCQTWPETGTEILEAVKDAIAQSSTQPRECILSLLLAL